MSRHGEAQGAADLGDYLRLTRNQGFETGCKPVQMSNRFFSGQRVRVTNERLGWNRSSRRKPLDEPIYASGCRRIRDNLGV